MKNFKQKIFLAFIFLIFQINILYAFPSKFDLREQNRVTSVKNQGIPGPCWAFAALGSCESNFLTQKLNISGKEPDLSEMQMAYFMYKDPKIERNFSSKIKSGTLDREGNVYMATAFLSRLSGPTDEKDLKYSTNNLDKTKKSLSNKSPEDYKRTMRLKNVYFLSRTRSPDNETRKKLIMNHGAISVSIYSDVFSYHTINKYYTYFENNSHGRKTNHEVLLIGWDDNFSRENFRPKPSKNGAWLVKNSWGTMRGTNNGYFWLSYEQYVYGGSTFIVEKNNPHLKHYGYDDLGWCESLNYRWSANIFKIQNSREILKEIAFYTPENNTQYEIHIYNLEKNPDSPISGKIISKLTGTIEYSGYHTIKLPESLNMKQNEYFSIVIKTPRSAPVETKRTGYSDNFLIHKNESYFSNDGINWIDGISLNANACIKAFTVH